MRVCVLKELLTILQCVFCCIAAGKLFQSFLSFFFFRVEGGLCSAAMQNCTAQLSGTGQQQMLRVHISMYCSVLSCGSNDRQLGTS